LTTLHPAAEGAARAAICAEDQGSFRTMHHYLMSTKAWQSDRDWMQAARASGIRDTSQFRQCLTAKSTQNRLDADGHLAKELRAIGTPTFYTRDSAFLGSRAVREAVAAGDSVTKRGLAAKKVAQ
jgi:protein-disulfide isomerase